MSVYIKGMEMPKRCDDCRFCDWIADTNCGPCAWCDVDGKARVADTRQDCPLVPVPDHGRLGDLDKLESGLRHMAKYQHGERQQGILGCCETIRLAPTVIPAEDGAERRGRSHG